MLVLEHWGGPLFSRIRGQRMHYVLPNVLAGLLASTFGCDPFDQNFWNFGPKLNGSVRSNGKSFEKTGPSFEEDQVGILVEWIVPLVTVGGSVWADHSGFLSPCHGGCDLGKMVVVPSPLGHLTSTRNLGVNPRFRLLPLSKKDCFLLF